MTSAEELQRLIYATLTGTAAINELVAGRVYDHVPPEEKRVERTGAAWPYISFGPYDANQDDADCIDGIEATLQIDIWSATTGTLECKTLTDLVRKALHHKSLSLSEHALVNTRVELWRVIPNPGGEHHGVVQVTALIEEQ